MFWCCLGRREALILKMWRWTCEYYIVMIAANWSLSLHTRSLCWCATRMMWCYHPVYTIRSCWQLSLDSSSSDSNILKICAHRTNFKMFMISSDYQQKLPIWCGHFPRRWLLSHRQHPLDLCGFTGWFDDVISEASFKHNLTLFCPSNLHPEAQKNLGHDVLATG
jgi:hypothetical protein